MLASTNDEIGRYSSLFIASACFALVNTRCFIVAGESNRILCNWLNSQFSNSTVCEMANFTLIQSFEIVVTTCDASNKLSQSNFLT